MRLFMLQSLTSPSWISEFIALLPSLLQAGAMSVLIGLVIIGVILAWKRNPNPNKDMDVAFATMAKIMDRLQNAMDTNQEKQFKTDESNRKNAENQIAATKEQTGILREQNILLTDFKNYQKLNNDQTADVGKKVEQNSAHIAELRASIDRLSDQIKQMLEDKTDCQDAEERIKGFRDEIIDIVIKQQAKRATDEHAVSNVTLDTAPAPEADSGQAANREAA